jgi:hypothetical protein
VLRRLKKELRKTSAPGQDCARPFSTRRQCPVGSSWAHPRWPPGDGSPLRRDRTRDQRYLSRSHPWTSMKT